MQTESFYLLDNNHILEIIEELRKSELSFADLFKKSSTKNHGHLNYYLKQLIKDKIILNDGKYRLTQKGIRLGVYAEKFKKKQEYPLPVICLVCKIDKKFFLTKRTVSPFKGYLAFPGGRILIGEKINAAAKRIALEEVGCKIRILKLAGVYPTLSYSEKSLSYHAFLIPVLVKPLNKKIIKRENLFSIEEAKKEKIIPVNIEIIENLDKGFVFEERVIK